MYRGYKISLIVPCHNEEKGLSSLLEEINSNELASIIDEIIVVDNGSTDETQRIALEKGAKVVVESKRGYGYAYLRGFEITKGDVIITMDGDGSYPPSAIKTLLQSINDRELFFISGNRLSNEELRKTMPFLNRLCNRYVSKVVSLILKREIKDCHSGMWCFHRSLIAHLKGIDSQMAFSQEIKAVAIKTGAQFIEVPIEYRVRMGVRKFDYLKDSIGIIRSLIKLWTVD